MYLVIIEADYNDGDYITRTHEIENIETVEEIARIYNLIKPNHCQWGRGDAGYDCRPEDLYDGILTLDEIDFFNSYLPHGEYGIHTVDSVEAYEIRRRIQI